MTHVHLEGAGRVSAKHSRGQHLTGVETGAAGHGGVHYLNVPSAFVRVEIEQRLQPRGLPAGGPPAEYLQLTRQAAWGGGYLFLLLFLTRDRQAE